MSLFKKEQIFKCAVFITFTLICVFHETNAQCPEVGCVDCFSWCESQKNFVCSRSYLRRYCRETCKACPTNAEVCLNLNCAQRCILSTDGTRAECACDQGYQLDEDGRTCNDIDECAVNGTSLCENSQSGKHCYNLEGGFACVSCNVNNSKVWNYYNSSECCTRNEDEKCGKSLTNGRVVGGSNSKIRSWPWTVYLSTGENPCGGSLITKNHFVTAAHCVANIRLDLITVFLGVEDLLDQNNIHAQIRNIIQIHIHPDYNYPYNDIAVALLDEPVSLNNLISTICLPSGEEPKVGEVCYASGFGQTDPFGQTSTFLQEVDLPIVDDQACYNAYSDQTNRINSTTQFCAGYPEGGKDTCRGDSGGPLMCQRCNSCNWYLAGVTSFGRSCASPGFYGVYTKVLNFEQWITNITNQPLHQQTCVKPVWQQWGNWSQCSATCGRGSRTRTRLCLNGSVGDAGCMGSTSETIDCDGGDCTVWSSCSVTCGVGIQTRIRNNRTETRVCTAQRLCPTWSEFGEWGDCSLTCGGGIRRSFRQCLNGFPGENGCLGSSERLQLCNAQCCPSWSEFSPFSSCSVSCGGGVMTSYRTCQCGEVGDVGCEGNETRQAPCATEECIGTWGEFGGYGSCSVSCGGGTQSRTRQCFGGKCIGQAEESRSCNEERCSNSTSSSCFALENVIRGNLCCQWAEQNYCRLYSSYMEANCAKVCCEYTQEGSCSLRSCSDLIEPSRCRNLIQHCSLPAVATYCRATCNLCK